MKEIDLGQLIRPDVTMIDNSIIDRDMLEANELQLKVYLYILRHAGAGHDIHTSSIADYFNETEKEILRAISFWEKRGVLRFKQSAQTSYAPGSVSMPETLEFSAPAPRQREALDFRQISFVAETYMGKPLSRTDFDILNFIKDSLNFSNELIEFLIEYCAERGRKSFKYAQTVACAWAEQGITTPEEAKARSTMFQQRIYVVMNALGKKSDPTDAELSYINRWYQQYGFEADVILEACRRTVLAVDKNRFSYAEKILSSWYKAGIRCLKDISLADASFQSKQRQNANGSQKVPAYVANNPFLQHKQNAVDYDALEKQLLQQ